MPSVSACVSGSGRTVSGVDFSVGEATQRPVGCITDGYFKQPANCVFRSVCFGQPLRQLLHLVGQEVLAVRRRAM